MNSKLLPKLTLLASLTTVITTTASAQLIDSPVSGADVELFQFTTPAGTGSKVVVAKFVTEDPSPGPFVPLNPLDDLRF